MEIFGLVISINEIQRSVLMYREYLIVLKFISCGDSPKRAYVIMDKFLKNPDNPYFFAFILSYFVKKIFNSIPYFFLDLTLYNISSNIYLKIN